MWRTRSRQEHLKAIVSSASSRTTLFPSHPCLITTVETLASSHPLSFFSSIFHPTKCPRSSISLFRSFSTSLATAQRLECEQLEEERSIPIKAYFHCTSIDLKGLQQQNDMNVVKPISRSSNYIVLRFGDVNALSSGLDNSSGNGRNCSYMLVFQYGSVILFNVSDQEVDRYLKIVEKHASGLVSEMRKDDYMVVEKPTLDAWMQGGIDNIMLRNLDTDGIRIIGSVLGQSIALDHYISQVDGLVAEFTDINREMEKIGTFSMQRKKLFQLVGKANSNLADVILKLGLFERSEIAWKDGNYAQILDYLRDEYELAQRFGSLDFKLKFVMHNIHFLQEVLQNRKSNFLEWLIILLIAVELLISIAHYQA